MDNFDPKSVLFTPQRVSQLGLIQIDENQRNQGTGVRLFEDLKPVDKKIIPAKKGDVIAFLGRPGHGKTGAMMYSARRIAKKIQDQNRFMNDPTKHKGEYGSCVVYVTLEQTVEDLFTFSVAAESGLDIGKLAQGNINEQEWANIQYTANGVGSRPMFIIGHSGMTPGRRPQLTPKRIAETLHYMREELGIIPEIVFIDYLQRFPVIDSRVPKNVIMSSYYNDCKEGALETACPWAVGVQATRGVDDYNPWPIPHMGSGQWTSEIEQSSDLMFSTVRPSKYVDQGDTFKGVTVHGYNQLLLTCLKQKLGASNWDEWLSFQPEYNRFDMLEVKNYDLRDDHVERNQYQSSTTHVY